MTAYRGRYNISMYIDMNKHCLEKNLDVLAGQIRVLGEPTRLKITCLLTAGPLCVCEIFERLGLPQNLVSHHLKTLLDAGIVSNRRDGKKIIYALSQEKMRNLQTELKNILPL